VFSFGGNLFGLAALIGLPVGGLMAFMTAQLSWFWETFQWAGVLGVGILTWLLVGIGLNLYKHFAIAKGAPINPTLIIAGIACVVMIGALISYSRSDSHVVTVTPATAMPSVDNEASIFIPKLGTQTAKEDFQKAINDLSRIVRQVDDIVKISAPIAGNRPLVRQDLNGAASPMADLQHVRTLYSVAHEQLIGGGEGQFFGKFPPSPKRALLSILPRDSQAIFEKYDRELLKLTVALMLVQDAERHKEDGAQYQRAISNAEFLADDFRLPISKLHDWASVMSQRMDQMSNRYLRDSSMTNPTIAL
jgi:hypothetical protein